MQLIGGFGLRDLMVAARHRRIPGASRPMVDRVRACRSGSIGVIAPWTRGSLMGVPLKEVGAMTSLAADTGPAPRDGGGHRQPLARGRVRAGPRRPPGEGRAHTQRLPGPPTRPGRFTDLWLPAPPRVGPLRGAAYPSTGLGRLLFMCQGPGSLARRGHPQVSAVGLGRVTARQDLEPRGAGTTGSGAPRGGDG